MKINCAISFSVVLLLSCFQMTDTSNILNLLPEKLDGAETVVLQKWLSGENLEFAREKGYAVEIVSDFNNDGASDKALIGIYTLTPEDKNTCAPYFYFYPSEQKPTTGTFVLIVTKISEKWKTVFFKKFPCEQRLFLRQPIVRGNGVLNIFTTVQGTDFFYEIEWDGEQYIYIEPTGEDGTDLEWWKNRREQQQK